MLLHFSHYFFTQCSLDMMRAFFLSLALLCTMAQVMRGQPADSQVEPLSILAEMRGFDIGSALSPSEDFASRLAPPPSIPAAGKNPVLAGLLSLLVPGAGELYAGNYLLAGLFAALEGAGWYFSIDASRKGDSVTEQFERYADQNWSVVKYAEWLNENARNYPGGENAVHIEINPDESLPPWKRVNWTQLHVTEGAIPQFSHKLPSHGDQQYYEMIGKYNQYSYGWNDKTEGDYWNASSNFLYYSGLRGDANRYYDVSRMFVNLIIVNHFLSAIDAAWAAARFNKAVQLRSGAHLQRLPDGRPDLVATARLSFHF
jgi:hypothetical protein